MKFGEVLKGILGNKPQKPTMGKRDLPVFWNHDHTKPVGRIERPSQDFTADSKDEVLESLRQQFGSPQSGVTADFSIGGRQTGKTFQQQVMEEAILNGDVYVSMEYDMDGHVRSASVVPQASKPVRRLADLPVYEAKPFDVTLKIEKFEDCDTIDIMEGGSGRPVYKMLADGCKWTMERARPFGSNLRGIFAGVPVTVSDQQDRGLMTFIQDELLKGLSIEQDKAILWGEGNDRYPGRSSG